MSSAPLIGAPEREDSRLPPPESGTKKCAKVCGLGCGTFLLVAFVLVWLLQGIMYAWATSLQGCRAGALEGFNYDGDAGATENPMYNLMPRLTLLTERNPRHYIMPFYVFPSNEASTLAGGQVGTWWRTWGPIFYTYTYEDLSSKTTIFMRKNLLRIGSSHRIARCDGKGPFVTFTEGSNWFGNRVRKVLGYNQAMTFKIYTDDDLVGYAEEAQGEVPSLTFRNANNDFLGSSVLLDPNFHGSRAHWLVKNNHSLPFPYFVSNAATLLFAFHILSVETAERVSSTPAPDAAPALAAAFLSPGNASSPSVALAPGLGEQAAAAKAKEAVPAVSAAAPAAAVRADPKPKAAPTVAAVAPAAALTARAEQRPKVGEKAKLQHV